MPRKDPHDNLARMAAEIYLSGPHTHILPSDWFSRPDPDYLTGDQSLNLRNRPLVIGETALEAMLNNGLDPTQFKLQRTIARKSIKYIPNHEALADLRQRTANRLNNPVH